MFAFVSNLIHLIKFSELRRNVGKTICRFAFAGNGVVPGS